MLIKYEGVRCLKHARNAGKLLLQGSKKQQKLSRTLQKAFPRSGPNGAGKQELLLAGRGNGKISLSGRNKSRIPDVTSG